MYDALHIGLMSSDESDAEGDALTTTETSHLEDR